MWSCCLVIWWVEFGHAGLFFLPFLLITYSGVHYFLFLPLSLILWNQLSYPLLLASYIISFWFSQYYHISSMLFMNGLFTVHISCHHFHQPFQAKPHPKIPPSGLPSGYFGTTYNSQGGYKLQWHLRVDLFPLKFILQLLYHLPIPCVIRYAQHGDCQVLLSIHICLLWHIHIGDLNLAGVNIHDLNLLQVRFCSMQSYVGFYHWYLVFKGI